ncbi:hypothetical protein EV121DRAFT_254637, partial [Schizophyllum commune]
ARSPFVLAVISGLLSQWSFSFQLSQLQVSHSTRALTLRFALATYALHILDVFRRQQCFRVFPPAVSSATLAAM